ncbi:Uncharacterized protein AC496_0827 [Pseudomonas savastanoi pv. glycinea]|uniref:Uncharacterized protein n=1 Tax=Pseudomonas savastanoi pv. glycinea TaxID=318 RepID=A0ABR5LE86_PSESG|nr:Uncharacterized protein AC497_5033 [Pseudomonas savastanoi pv. glycinea]KPC45362.1 Uncharacterized protein AC496_0827 [Pseudomonas savastanoi pv. glycinea]KPC55546.1 Uncharacterized protein ABK00_2193 [Pseudomonas savastanoi pv. glycinea]RMR37171.1 hypothetical protein ALP91_200019 [Pseudomonas savastanoi pv. glycinea]
MQNFYVVERGLDGVQMFIPTIGYSTYARGNMKKKTLQKLKVVKKKIIPSSAIT